MSRRWAIWALAALTSAGGACAEDLTLDEAIRLALASNRSLRNTVLQSKELDERKASFKTQLLPSAHVFALVAQPVSPFDFTVSKGTLGVDSAGALLPQSDVALRTPAHPLGITALTVTEPLSSIPSIRRGLAILDIQKNLAEEQTRLERQTLIRDVRQLYYGIQSVQSALRAAQENVRLAQEVVRVTAQYVEKRQVLDVDYLEAQVHLAQAMESVLDLDNQRETLKSKLNHKIGRDVLTDFTVPSTSGAPEATPFEALDQTAAELAEARRRALEQRPETREASLRVEQARLELRNTGSAYNPAIAAQFTDIGLMNATNFLPRQIGLLGVSMTWEPFTWGRRKHDLDQKRYELEAAVNREQEAKGAVAIDLAEQFRRVQLSAARLRVANLSRQMAVEALRIAQKQYEAQYSLVKTVLQAQASLERTAADYQRTLGELWTARAEYQRAMGQDQ